MIGQSCILLVSCLVSGSLAKPPPTFLEYKDSFGQYSFGYSAPGSARSEVRSSDGSTRGSYSYVDDAGVIQSAQYTADGEHGFQIVATNLPQAPRPVEETPEVLAARHNHLMALEAATRLAEESPEMARQPDAEVAVDGKSASSIAIESSSANAEDAAVQIEAKGAKTDEDHSTEQSQNAQKAPIMKVTAKIGVVSSEEESAQIMEKSSRIGVMRVQPQQRGAAPSRSDVPVVTTSFVIPGRVNLHSRVELDQTGFARFSPEPLPVQMVAAQSLVPQGQASFEPSMMTPAATRMMTLATGEKSAMPNVEAKTNSAPLQYSAAFVPGVVAPANVYTLPYGIGINPIFHQYNPYRYFPYGIL